MPPPVKDLKSIIEHPAPVYKFDDQTRIDFPLFPTLAAIVGAVAIVMAIIKTCCQWCVDYRKAVTKVEDIESSLISVKADQTREFAAIREAIANLRSSMMLAGKSTEELEKQFGQLQLLLKEKISILQSHEIDRARLEANINFIKQEFTQLESDIKNIRATLKQ